MLDDHALVMFFVSLTAAFVDAAAGGGGLIQMPGLLLLFPQIPFPALAGTNKMSSACGTFIAARTFAKRATLNRKVITLLVPLTFAGALLGAYFVSVVRQDYVKPVVAVVLAGVWLLSFFRKELGSESQHTTDITNSLLAACLLAAGVGFYDGMIGPGTGMFFLFGFVSLLGTSFVSASSIAKTLNLTSNIASLIYFAPLGLFVPHLLLFMIPGHLLGGHLGATFALKKGSGFIRLLALWVTAILICKLISDSFFATS